MEQPDGEWTCRLGLEGIDHHGDLAGALTHMQVLALDYEPSESFVHHADGRVVRAIHAEGP